MDFNEKLALELIEKHNLPRRFLYSWRQKGAIPQKYLSSLSEEKVSKLLKVMERVVATKLCEDAGANYYHYNDVLHGRVKMKESEYNKLKKELRKMGEEISKL